MSCRCSMRSSETENAHLFLRNLQEFDVLYLKALLEGNSAIYLRIETHAKSLGIGPLAPCTFAASCCEQKQTCRMYIFFLMFQSGKEGLQACEPGARSRVRHRVLQKCLHTLQSKCISLMYFLPSPLASRHGQQAPSGNTP